MQGNTYRETLKNKMDQYVHFIYGITKSFPKEEIFGSVSQIRRAGLSVVLNYTEGYARRKPLVLLNFYEIAYGSLQESKYLLLFAKDEKYIPEDIYKKGEIMANEIGAMLWKEIQSIEKSIK